MFSIKKQSYVQKGLEFKSRVGQTLHSVANGSPPTQHIHK